MVVRDLLRDNRFWLVTLLSLGLLVTLERVQVYANGSWPQMRRDRQRRPLAMGNRAAWNTVMFFLLPGVVLLLADVAILLWAHYPQRSTLVLAAFLLILPWLIFIAGSLESLGVTAYVRRVGIALPLALCASLLLADLLLLVTLIDLVQGTDLVHAVRNVRG